MIRQGGQLLAVATFALALTGCRHRTVSPVLPVPPATPVPVARSPDTAGTVPTLPTVPPPLIPVEVPRKIKRRRKAPTTLAAAPGTPPLPAPAAPDPAPAPAVATPAPAAPAGAEVLNAITPGGDESSAKYREARDLIAALDKQLSGVPAALQQTQGEQIARIVHFDQEAQKALRGGDADGAITLATKAKLLLDDLTK